MTALGAAYRRLVAVLGNEGAVANASALGHQRHRERWVLAALERSLAATDAAHAIPVPELRQGA